MNSEGVYLDLELEEEREKNANFPIPEVDYKDVIEKADKFNKEVVDPARKQEADESLKEFNKVIENEDDFLAKFDESRFDLEVLFDGDLLKMKILPLTPGMDASLLEADKSIFNDLTKAQRLALQKSINGEKLTPKQTEILTKLNKEYESRSSESILDKANHVLAQHIRPPELGSFEERLEFWEKRGGSYLLLKTFLVNEIVQRIGTDQRSMIKLFRSN